MSQGTAKVVDPMKQEDFETQEESSGDPNIDDEEAEREMEAAQVTPVAQKTKKRKVVRAKEPETTEEEDIDDPPTPKKRKMGTKAKRPIVEESEPEEETEEPKKVSKPIQKKEEEKKKPNLKPSSVPAAVKAAPKPAAKKNPKSVAAVAAKDSKKPTVTKKPPTDKDTKKPAGMKKATASKKSVAVTKKPASIATAKGVKQAPEVKKVNLKKKSADGKDAAGHASLPNIATPADLARPNYTVPTRGQSKKPLDGVRPLSCKALGKPYPSTEKSYQEESKGTSSACRSYYSCMRLNGTEFSTLFLDTTALKAGLAMVPESDSDTVFILPFQPQIPGYDAVSVLPCMDVQREIDELTCLPGIAFAGVDHTVAAVRVCANNVFINSKYVLPEDLRLYVVSRTLLEAAVSQLPPSMAARIYKEHGSERIFIAASSPTGQSDPTSVQSIPILEDMTGDHQKLVMPYMSDIAPDVNTVRVRIDPKFFNDMMNSRALRSRSSGRRSETKGGAPGPSTKDGNVILRVYGDNTATETGADPYFVLVLQFASDDGVGIDQCVYTHLKPWRGEDVGKVSYMGDDGNQNVTLSMDIAFISGDTRKPMGRGHGESQLPVLAPAAVTEAAFSLDMDDDLGIQPVAASASSSSGPSVAHSGSAAPLPTSIKLKGRTSMLQGTEELAHIIMSSSEARRVFCGSDPTLLQENTVLFISMVPGDVADGTLVPPPFLVRGFSQKIAPNAFVQAHTIAELSEEFAENAPDPKEERFQVDNVNLEAFAEYA